MLLKGFGRYESTSISIYIKPGAYSSFLHSLLLFHMSKFVWILISKFSYRKKEKCCVSGIFLSQQWRVSIYYKTLNPARMSTATKCGCLNHKRKKKKHDNYYTSFKYTCDRKDRGFIMNSSSLYKVKVTGPILEEIWMSFLPRKIEAAWGRHKGVVNL